LPICQSEFSLKNPRKPVKNALKQAKTLTFMSFDSPNANFDRLQPRPVADTLAMSIICNRPANSPSYPQLLGQKSAILPGSIFNRQDGSVFNQRQQSNILPSQKGLQIACMQLLLMPIDTIGADAIGSDQEMAFLL